MNLFDFIKWCFRDEDSTIVTLIFLSGLSYFLLKVISILKGGTYEECDCDEDDTIQELIDECNTEIEFLEEKKEKYSDYPAQIKLCDEAIDNYNFMIIRLSKHLT